MAVGPGPHPIDVADAADTAWLETLVWPEQTDRLRSPARGHRVARRDPPRIVHGDLLNDLPDHARGRRPVATLVVFHSAVLGLRRRCRPARRLRA